MTDRIVLDLMLTPVTECEITESTNKGVHSMSTYDTKTRMMSNSPSPSGMKGQISFHRLTDLLRRNGEIQKNEIVTHYEMRGDFLVYSLEYDR